MSIQVIWLSLCHNDFLSTSSTSGYFALLHFALRVNLSTAFKESESSITCPSLQLRERILHPLLLQAPAHSSSVSPHPQCLRVKAAGITSPTTDQCFLNPVLEGGWFLARGRRQWSNLSRDGYARSRGEGSWERAGEVRGEKAAQFSWQSLQVVEKAKPLTARVENFRVHLRAGGHYSQVLGWSFR